MNRAGRASAPCSSGSTCSTPTRYASAEKYPASIFLFDLLWLDGPNRTAEPLSKRNRLLCDAARWSDRVRWTEIREGGGTELFRAACRRGEVGAAVESGARMATVNRGETPYDRAAALRVEAGIGEGLPPADLVKRELQGR